MDASTIERTISELGPWLLGLVVGYLVLELGWLYFRQHVLRLRESRMAILGVLSNGIAGALTARLWLPLGIGVAAEFGSQLSPIPGFGLGWGGWLVGWLIYEFWYWVQHWAGHKVRVLWCIHSAHHAPRGINMLIGTNHHLLEGTFYFPLFLGLLPALCGVHPLICVAINIVDSVWGSFLHISDSVVKTGRYG